MSIIQIPTKFYRQYDADWTQENPAQHYQGWDTAMLPLDLSHTAVVLMHAWDCGAPQQYPGWYRAVDYLPRQTQICTKVLSVLLRAVRQSELSLFHVVGGGDYYKNCPGYHHATALAGTAAPLPTAAPDDTVRALLEFHTQQVSPGAHNLADIEAGNKKINFFPGMFPEPGEGVAENAAQLFALCREKGINHLIYTGFAINWCLLMSPGGMVDMSRYGLLCSVIPQAVSAVENAESSAGQGHKEEALWRVSVGFGYVYDIEPLMNALK